MCSEKDSAMPENTVNELNGMYKEYWEEYLVNRPTRATYMGDHRYNDKLEDLSEEAYQASIDSYRDYLRRLSGFDPDVLEGQDRLNYLLFKRLLEVRIEGSRFRPYLMPVSQQGGPHISFPQIVTYHPFKTVKDYEDYTKRLDAFPDQIEQVIANMEKGMASDLVRSRVVVEEMVPQIETLIIDSPEKSPFYEPLSEFPEDVTDDERARIRGEVERAIMESIVPAYQDLLVFIGDRYIHESREEVGIWALPEGAERYSFAIKQYTTMEMSPEEIHEIGLGELERIREEMEKIRMEVGFRGDLGEFIIYLRSDPQFYHSSPSDLMEGFREILNVMDGKMPLLFGHLPKAAYDLKEIEPYRAAAAPAAYYYSPPEDGSRPGYFYVNTYRPDSRPRYTMEALAYHEAVPGHHLQIAIAQELDELPDFRQHEGFTVFVEGWGLYSESLPVEVGLYKDPYSRFGRLTFDAWRASRLVVDTGIHALRWERQQAIDFLKERTALSEHDIISEIDRYIAWPGQALAYKIGELKIRELRRYAEDRLGERFDVREFHDTLLQNGSIPLDVLESEIDNWLAGS
jgi:prolyl oligopeptidase